ncbi:MAG: adenosylmethionine decarboxylase [Candidatus Omnitrophica bacterium]|nr:adenosylmethionine decarboxylase [Candidatus Omnitrophota bacterium]
MTLSTRQIRGRHLLVDFFGVDEDKLRNRRELMRILCSALRDAGFNILRKTGSHKFEGGGEGVTGFVLLSESHAAFHSYPECRYLALDIYSCGRHDPEPIAKAVRQYLCPKKVKTVYQKRG